MARETFGDLLRNERQQRGLSIDAVARTLPAEPTWLRALERNDFDALPDEATMRACLERYAACLEVEADLMIADYDRERERFLLARERKQALDAQPPPKATPETAPAAKVDRPLRHAPPPAARHPQPTHPHPPRQAIDTRGKRGMRIWPALMVIVAAALVAAALGGLLGRWRSSHDGAVSAVESPAPRLEQTGAEQAPPEPVESPIEAPPETAPPADVPRVYASPPGVAPSEVIPPDTAPTESAATEEDPPTVAPAPPPAAAASHLTIAEHGVGTGVDERRLVGRGDRFPAGSRVWYWTRVLGGSSGDRIEHVWLQDGVEASRITLRVGGPTWRTFSAVTLPTAGSEAWAVEARDANGTVLARREFTSDR